MADLKISQLSAVSEVQETDVFPTVSGLATMKASAAQIKTYVTESLDANDSAVEGSYVTAVSEADGVISVTREAADVNPTANSTKMLTSGGAKAALDKKQNVLTFDNTPTENSNNPVKSGGVYTEVNSLKETLENQINYDANTGVKNVWNIDEGQSTNASLTSSYGFTNTATDTRTKLRLQVASQDASGTWSAALLNDEISSTGHHEFTVSIPSNAVKVRIRHNGSERTMGVTAPIYRTGSMIVSIDLVANDPTTVGGLIVNNIMVRDAHIVDTTYEPYAATNQQLTGLIPNSFVNGAVNLLPNEATTQTINGVTFTVNDDGTITANGTSTKETWFYLLGKNSSDYKMIPNIAGKKLRLSGCPSGSDGSNYTLRFFERTPVTSGHIDSGGGNTFIVQTGLTGCNSAIYINSGITVSNKVFKPMITVADMPNSDYNHYVPYAKSNKELTDATDIIDISNSFFTANSGYTVRDPAVYKQGKHIFGNFVIQCTNTIGTVDETAGSMIYPPLVDINSGCFMSAERYGQATYGASYCMIERSDAGGDVIFRDMSGSGYKYCKIQLNYVTA